MNKPTFKLLALSMLLALPAVLRADYQAPFYYVVQDNISVSIAGYDGSVGALIIPSSLSIPSITNSLPVTRIGGQAFEYNTNLTSVMIPASVTSIGDYAFSYTRLTSMVIPDTVTNIGVGTLNSCFLLTNALIGNHVTSLGHTFYYCTNLNHVEIGNNVTSIGQQAFFHCTSLTNITFPDSLTFIGDMSFRESGLIKLLIPNGVTNIDQDAFADCTNLNNVAIGNGVTTVGNQAFYSCFALTNVIIVGNGVTTIGGLAFAYCSTLTSLIIGNGVKTIGDAAFSQCASLARITIPANVNVLGSGAFSPCTNLTTVFFQGDAPQLANIDYGAFGGDTKATAYYLPGTTGWGQAWWGTYYDILPAMLWNPQPQTSGAGFGVRTNRFGFNITGSSNLVIVVEACTNMASPVWSPLSTNTLNTFIGTNGTSYFSDSQWTNYPGRFYRLRSP